MVENIRKRKILYIFTTTETIFIFALFIAGYLISSIGSNPIGYYMVGLSVILLVECARFHERKLKKITVVIDGN